MRKGSVLNFETLGRRTQEIGIEMDVRNFGQAECRPYLSTSAFDVEETSMPTKGGQDHAVT